MTDPNIITSIRTIAEDVSQIRIILLVIVFLFCLREFLRKDS